MDVRAGQSVEDAADLATELVAAAVEANPQAALLPATGNTPVPLYRKLAERARGGMVASDLRIFQLDEYVGVAGEDPRSLYGWIARELLDPLHISPDQVTRLRGDVDDLEAECARYEAAVTASGGIDLAVLGLGLDGHLGYNEPPSPADAPTRVVPLRPESRATAASYWPPGTPTPDRGITAGMSVILAARKIILLVTGGQKRAILRQVLDGPVGPDVPASWLRHCPDVTVIADREALGTD